jgi:ACR3 family arsenite efflux pump ArsB
MGVKKLGITYGIALVVGLYTTFVVQSLWNWFAVKAFNVPSVSYWEMYGLTMLLGLLLARDGEQDEQNWKTAFLILDVCVPQEKRDELVEELKARNEGLWLELGLVVFGKAVGNSLTLAIGWAVYTFFVSS